MDPLLVDVYVNMLELNEISKKLADYQKNYLPVPAALQKKVKLAVQQFDKLENQAIKLYGSSDAVYAQIRAFHQHTGDA